MNLNHKIFGQGHPLVILHGLFGMLDNWQTLGKKWADDYMVYLVDQRNHGRSPHRADMSYPAMAGDLKEFLEQNWVHRSHVLGHSMGGKSAMQLALSYPDLVEKLVVVDMSPRKYGGGHAEIFKALFSVDLANIEDRSEADAKLAERISEKSIRQFLLKNLRRKKTGGYEWKANIHALRDHYGDILAALGADHPFEGPTLFVRGGKSPYVKEDDMELIREYFPEARLETIADAGHWVHADQPQELFSLVRDFLQE